MFKLTFKYPLSKADDATEELYIADIYNVFYESPITITTNEYGYGYTEKKDEFIDFNVVVESDNLTEAKKQRDLIKKILKVKEIEIIKIDEIALNETLEPIHLNDSWVIASPEYEFEDKNKLTFLPQGAFGTGLHETTQDSLRYILSQDFTNKNVLDIGAGSGILSIAAGLKNAKYVASLDVRDVEEEIQLNASLNNLNNISVFVGNALENEITINDKFDFVFMNISGEEATSFLNFIENHIKENGILLITGLVEWSFDFIVNKVKKYGYELIEENQTNEWCTAILKKVK